MHVLNTRTDLEAQRLWVTLAHQQVETFVRKTDVSYFPLASLFLSILTPCYSLWL
jgi:hypothetical protein